jgi:hypothetical protein
MDTIKVSKIKKGHKRELVRFLKQQLPNYHTTGNTGYTFTGEGVSFEIKDWKLMTRYKHRDHLLKLRAILLRMDDLVRDTSSKFELTNEDNTSTDYTNASGYAFTPNGKFLLTLDGGRIIMPDGTYLPVSYVEDKLANYCIFSSAKVVRTEDGYLSHKDDTVQVLDGYGCIHHEHKSNIRSNNTISRGAFRSLVAYKCSECEKWYYVLANTLIAGDDIYCGECAKHKNIGKCKLCLETKILNKLGVCPQCNKHFKSLMGYGYTPKNPINKQAPLLVGIENELTSEELVSCSRDLANVMEGLVREFGYLWSCTEDGSVEDCLEWTSRASNGRTLPNKLDKFIRHDIGEAPETGGLHVTFEKDIMSSLRWAELVILLAKKPNFWYRLGGRITNRQLQVVDHYANISSMVDGVSFTDRLKKIMTKVRHGNDKYRGIRFKKNLAEFRFPAAASNKKLGARTEAIIALVEYAKYANVSKLSILGYENYVKDNTNLYPRTRDLIKSVGKVA